MSKNRGWGFFLIIHTFIVFYFAGVSNSFAFETYFSPKDNLDDVVVQEIQKAKVSLDISIYTFRSNPIIQAIVNQVKQNPKLKIRILIRRVNMDHLVELFSPLELALKQSGLSVDGLRSVSVTNHHKFIIVDGKTLLNSSANFNDSELQTTYDENIFVCSRSCPDLVWAFEKEFEYLYGHSHSLFLDELFGSKVVFPQNQKAQSIKNLVLFSSENFEPVYKTEKKSFKLKSKYGKVAKKNLDPSEKTPGLQTLGWIEKNLLQQIHSAKRSIYVATGHLRSFTLAQALADVAKKGIKVELVLDGQEYLSPEYQAIENQEQVDCVQRGKTKEECVEIGFHFGRWLSDQGVQVFFKYYMVFWNFMDAPQMHHKYMIVDERLVFTGSYNWSKNAEFRTFENLAVIDHKQTVNEYLTNFNHIKNYGLKSKSSSLSFYDNLINQWLNEKKAIDLIFEPMTLTAQQIDDLRLLLVKKCPDIFKTEIEDLRSSEIERGLDVKPQCQVH